jgi:tetratricopeptide (TPR) repeat protein
MPPRIRMWLIACVAMVLGVVQPALCQRGGGSLGGGGGRGPGGGGITGPGLSTGAGNGTGIGNGTMQPNYPGTNSPDSLNGAIYLTGKVVMEDGSPPPDIVTIERTCNSSHQTAAYTDSKGHFSFQWGQTAGVFQDASDTSSNVPGVPRSNSPLGATLNGPSGTSTMQLADCDLKAALPGFRSDSVNLSGRRYMDNPDIGTIILHRQANVDGSVISVTSLLAPKAAQKAYEKGREDLRKEKLPEAQQYFEKAVEWYPKYATAWFELGRIHEHDKLPDKALYSYQQAIAADPKFLSPYLQIAQLDADKPDWPALASITERLVKLDAVDYPVAYYYSAMANLNLGKFDDAEKSARQCEKLDKTHQYARVEEMLGALMTRKKDYAAAAAHLRGYLEQVPNADDAAKVRSQLAEIERRSGATARAASGSPAGAKVPEGTPATSPR